MTEGHPSTAEIRLEAVCANAAELARRAGGRSLIAVVKADAYGHGAVPVARALCQAGCERLAVMSVAEGAVLRDAGIAAPVLVLGGVHGAAEAAAAARGLTPVLHHAGQVELCRDAARAAGHALPVHVEVDTGMRRMGVPAAAAPALLEQVQRAPELILEGVFTHFARGDEVDLGPTLDQLRRFREVLAAARARGVEIGLVHAAHSAGVLAGKEISEALPEAGAVRPGLSLYGVRPAPHLAAELAPAMTLRTRVVLVRDVAPGEAVGYAALFRARRATRVATLPLGYADGVPVAASNRGHVLVRGRRLPMVGRVSMDYVTVDAGDAPVEIGDEAILFGEGAGGRLPVEEAAEAAGTIPYELLVRVGSRVPRTYI